MKKYLFLFSVLSFCHPALSADLDAMKLDAAKRASCSKSTPCGINIKGHNGTYVVKINDVTITKDGVININHHEYQRFVYDTAGKFMHKINGE